MANRTGIRDAGATTHPARIFTGSARACPASTTAITAAIAMFAVHLDMIIPPACRCSFGTFDRFKPRLRFPHADPSPRCSGRRIRLPPSGRHRLPMRRVHFEQLCFLRGCERKKAGIGKIKVAPGAAAHQRCCILVVAQSNGMPQFVGNNIACEAGRRPRICPKARDCDQNFPNGWPRGREWIETVPVGQGNDHVTVRFPDAVQQRRRNDARRCPVRAEVVSRDRSKTMRCCAQAERTSKPGELGVPELDRLANGWCPEIIPGR